eukprot:gene505-8019_t
MNKEKSPVITFGSFQAEEIKKITKDSDFQVQLPNQKNFTRKTTQKPKTSKKKEEKKENKTKPQTKKKPEKVEKKVENKPKGKVQPVQIEVNSWTDLFQTTPKSEPEPQPVPLKIEKETTKQTKEKQQKQENKKNKKTYNSDGTAILKNSILNLTSIDSVNLQPRGLINYNNSCYINAILQGLLYTPNFYTLFKNLSKLKLDPKIYPLTNHLCHFVSEFSMMIKKSTRIDIGTSFAPTYLLNYLNSNEVKTIKQGSQQDSQEFLGWLLEELHTELLKTNDEIFEDSKNDIKFEQDIEWEEVGKKNKTSQIRDFKQKETSISEIFGGKIRSSIKKKNQKPILSMEPFFTLHLPIDESVRSIKESFQLMTTFEDLNEGFLKQLSIEELPKVLILHLERFTYNKEMQSIEKITKKIQFYEDLYLDNFIVSKTKVPENDPRRNYELCALVCHHGKDASIGHYSTYISHPSDKWVHLDDTNVSIVSINQVLKQQAYLLFYVRK